MKELSIEGKATRYDQAIKVAKSKIKNDKDHVLYEDDVIDIFPELKESEDEKIRKSLIGHLKECRNNTRSEVMIGEYAKWISWLEKQVEQKPQGKSALETANEVRADNQNCVKPDKVEPKFKAGDWLIYENGSIYYVNKVYEHTYELVIDNDNKPRIPYELIDKKARLWTIQDAKDGDVLACKSGWTCIFKTLVNDETFSLYCFMDNTKWFCETGSECHTLNKEFVKAYNGEIKPATKEQRDTLMKAMADAGYTFDFEKKELKKIEQKPDTQHSTEWSISDFRTWQYIVSDVLTKKDGIGQYLDSGECKKIAKYMQEEWGEKLSKEQTQEELLKSEDYGIDGLYHAISILEKTLGKVEGFQSDDGILEHKCAISAVKELYKQNHAWSEEDEEAIAEGIIALEDMYDPDEPERCYAGYTLTFEKAAERLKSIRSQNRWKPSDLQIEALESATENCAYSEYQDCLRELAKQLKKI